MRKINEEGLRLLMSFEGLRLQAYRDIVGILTIGYGHTGSDVTENQQITNEQARDLLVKDISRFQSGVESLVKVPLTDNQFSALVCLAYNIGLANLKISTLLKRLNDSKYDLAANQFLVWDRAGGKEIAGLLRRRKAERELFLKDPNATPKVS